jgi:hypothetical protein
MIVRNKYNVSKKTWARWKHPARAIFNELYGVMMKNHWVFRRPDSPPITRKAWRTVCWNAAFVAADFASKSPITHVQDLPHGKPKKVKR